MSCSTALLYADFRVSVKNVTALMKEEKEACVLVHWAVLNRGARYKGDVCELLRAEKSQVQTVFLKDNNNFVDIPYAHSKQKAAC